MGNKNIYEPIFEKSCAVCSNKYMADIYGQGKCSHCGWRNGDTIEENKNSVVYPNLISLNKAKQLYKEGKSFAPNLDEFIEALFCYSEVQFEYNGIYYGVEINRNNEKISIIMYDIPSNTTQQFKTKEEFKNNAKIGNQYLKDIWNETTDRYWLQ